MADLAQWDFSTDFDGIQAASLIAGVPPAKYDMYEDKTGPIYRRLEAEYHQLRDWYSKEIDCLIKASWPRLKNNKSLSDADRTRESFEPFIPLLADRKQQSQDWLESIATTQWIARANTDRDISGFAVMFLHEINKSHFCVQKFERAEIVRWLAIVRLPSVYQFDLNETKSVEQPSSRWPWGNHHTELLGHLAAAAQRYWVKYDPTDATTAPTNKDVAEWLMAEHKVSQKMADAIASMLRPDGFPTGPRK
jgi:hypothetical protein